MSKIEENILQIIENRNKIPDDFWREAENGRRVIWILNRDDGTAGSYENSEERLGITKDGEILYGFSSGCSCWEGWSKDDYAKSVTYKEFIILNKQTKTKKEYNSGGYSEHNLSFVEGWEEEAQSNLKDLLLLIQDTIKPEEVLKAKNSEVRRYLMKRIGYENIKSSVDATVIHTDGTNELIDITRPGEAEKERYIKVKDSSTDREYLLYVPNGVSTCREAIAWTFDLNEEEYEPIYET